MTTVYTSEGLVHTAWPNSQQKQIEIELEMCAMVK
jgi:hypothetical protein